jgi:hypothetical protein
MPMPAMAKAAEKGEIVGGDARLVPAQRIGDAEHLTVRRRSEQQQVMAAEIVEDRGPAAALDIGWAGVEAEGDLADLADDEARPCRLAAAKRKVDILGNEVERAGSSA